MIRLKKVKRFYNDKLFSDFQSAKQKRAATQRKKTTSSNSKSATKTNADSSQRRLTTMFGYQKKVELVHS